MTGRQWPYGNGTDMSVLSPTRVWPTPAQMRSVSGSPGPGQTVRHRVSDRVLGRYAGRVAPANGIWSIGATRTGAPGRGAWIIWPPPM